MNCTLSFESFCKHCKNCTAFIAINIPEGLPADIICKLVDERSVDCCYSCYELVESTKVQATKLQTAIINKKS